MYWKRLSTHLNVVVKKNCWKEVPLFRVAASATACRSGKLSICPSRRRHKTIEEFPAGRGGPGWIDASSPASNLARVWRQMSSCNTKPYCVVFLGRFFGSRSTLLVRPREGINIFHESSGFFGVGVGFSRRGSLQAAPNKPASFAARCGRMAPCRENAPPAPAPA